MSDTFEVTTLSSTGCNSITEAILSKKNIEFKIKGTITLTQNLPLIRGENITIISNQDVIIDCNNKFQGLVLKKCSNITIQYLNISNSIGNGISLIDCNNINVEFSHLLNNGKSGLGIYGGNDNKLFRLLLSGNKEDGLHCINTNNIISKNLYIGVEFNGDSPMPNNKNGIYMNNTVNSQIGGTAVTKNNPTQGQFAVPPEGCLVSGNLMNGILLEKCKHIKLFGNFVGINYDGTSSQIGMGNGEDGLKMLNCESIITRGCYAFSNPFIYYNIFSGNRNGAGIHITDCKNIVIQGNFVGIDSMNSITLSNKNGVVIDGKSDGILIGLQIPLGGVISGSLEDGLVIKDEATHVISYNTFNGIAAFSTALPNGRFGTLITSKNSSPDHFNVIRTCIVSGNYSHGIACIGTSNVVIDSVILSMDTNGSDYTPNGCDNLYIDNSNNVNVISHAKSVIFTSNILSGARRNGITITNNSYNVNVESAFIGTNVKGVDSFSNLNGIVIEKGSHDNSINTNINNKASQDLSNKVDDKINEILAANPELSQMDNIDNMGNMGNMGNMRNGDKKDKIDIILENLPNIISGNRNVGIFLDETTYNNLVVNNNIGYDINKKELPNYAKQIVNLSDRNIIKDNLVYKEEK